MRIFSRDSAEKSRKSRSDGIFCKKASAQYRAKLKRSPELFLRQDGSAAKIASVSHIFRKMCIFLLFFLSGYDIIVNKCLFLYIIACDTYNKHTAAPNRAQNKNEKFYF